MSKRFPKTTGRRAALELAGDDRRLTWCGAISFQKQDGWVMPWRIPFAERGLFHEGLRSSAATAAGVRLRFRSNTRIVSGLAVPPVTQPKKLDLLVDGRLHTTFEWAPGVERFEFAGLPAGEKLLELWLPVNFEFRLRRLELDAGATVRPAPHRGRQWIAYGSSITQASDAASPSRTWPAIVARGLGLNLTSLGFGGECHLDGGIARMIGGLPADFISLCVGINIYGGGSFNARSFRPAIIDFVRTVRRSHPAVPITVMSPIWGFSSRETTANAAGLTLRAMRGEVGAAVAALAAHGDRHVHYVDGLSILGPEDWRLLPDNLHPGPEGYAQMGRTFLDKVARPLFGR